MIKYDIPSDAKVDVVDKAGLVFATLDATLDAPIVVVVSPSVAETGVSSVDLLGLFDEVGAVSGTVKYDVSENDTTDVVPDAAVEVLVETVDSVDGDVPVNTVEVADWPVDLDATCDVVFAVMSNDVVETVDDFGVVVANEPKDEVLVCTLVEMDKNEDIVDDIEVGWTVSSSVVVRPVLLAAAVSRQKP